MGLFYLSQIFQSTPPRRRRLPLMQSVPVFLHFNPRLREGGDNKKKLQNALLQDFNPRLREGGDFSMSIKFFSLIISIHASEKEATVGSQKREDGTTISIHASEKEATATYCDTSTIMYISSLNNFFVRYF